MLLRKPRAKRFAGEIIRRRRHPAGTIATPSAHGSYLSAAARTPPPPGRHATARTRKPFRSEARRRDARKGRNARAS